jgi:2-methylisocitrate lyase-like PEP mutase family enzyme
MAMNAKTMASAVRVSVIADTNTGDSNAMNAVRCAEEFIRLGGSAAVIGWRPNHQPPEALETYESGLG